MAERKLAIQLILLCVKLVVNGAANIPGYHKWSYGEREDLFCPDKCKVDKYLDRCCSCEGKPCWELDTTLCPIGKLHVEYLDSLGTCTIVGSTNATFVELIHTKGFLTKLQGDICTWATQLVTLDLRYNRLTDVKPYQCLRKLDTLRLDFNLIKYIDNTTFTKMKDLRVLTVSHNLLVKLDPNVITIEGGNIPIVDFSDNHKMDLLDLTNVFRPGPFCTLNYTNSYVEHLTNENGFVMEKIIHGPGDILLEHTHLGSFINFSSIGIEEMKEFGKYVAGMISIDASSVNCDCAVFPLLSSLGTDALKYWKNLDEQTFECYSPDDMKGKNLTTIVETGNFEGFKCDISEKPDCPHYLCHCIDMPSEHKVLVNCTGAGFNTMPDEMPVGAWNNYKIDLILVDNKITELPLRKYYSRLINLDLRQNNVTLLTAGAAETISSPLNIENQILEALPPIIQHRYPYLITFGPHPIVCDCSNTWLGDWIRLKNGHGRLNCSVNGVIIPAEDVSEFTLNCREEMFFPSAAVVASAAGVLLMFVLITGLCFLYRYEIMILKRTLFRKELKEGILYNVDVFLSFYEYNEGVFRMVRRYIKPALLEAGYTVFIPWEDIPYGTQRDDELAIAAGRSLNYVIVLCGGYAEDYNTVSELETIWKSFRADKAKQIVLINYDNLESNDIKDDRLRAMRRAHCLDFSTRNSELIYRLKNKLGKPLTQRKLYNLDDGGLKSEADPVVEELTDDDLNHEPYELLHTEGMRINENNLSVFDRLALPRASECNCKYRKCYLHDDNMVQRSRKIKSKEQINKVVPL